MESRRVMKAFGWGEPSVHFEAIAQDKVRHYLKEKLDTEVLYPQPKSFRLEELQLEASQLPDEVFLAFQRCLGAEWVSRARELRALYSGGRSFPDLWRMRSLQLERAPDLVLLPQREEQLPRLMDLAITYGLALIPFGGGTSVVGGLAAEAGEQRYTAAIDMTALKAIEAWDEESRILTVQAGIYGPELEAWLNAKGYTLGHFPQSFEYTTLGGWVAARSSGQNSLFYGSIDEMLVSLRVLTPRGLLSSPVAPRQACGPDIKQLLIGSEGLWGLVVACTLKCRPLPAERRYEAYLFRSFAAATTAARRPVRPAASDRLR